MLLHYTTTSVTPTLTGNWSYKYYNFHSTVTPTLTGATGATTFTSTPIQFQDYQVNATTGAINPSLMPTAGTYTI